ncbi:hypothetical protein [Chryseobacterium glaciei]|nr:hypothetical protein [Chryseobacterium glaciei]
MKLQLTQIVDRGTHNSEKVLIDVVEDANLEYYIIRDTTFTNGRISNKWVHVYEFLNQPVKKGDKVVLHTKIGNTIKKELGNGNTEYTYFWNLGNSVWNNDGDAALLYELNTWQILSVNNTK